MTLVVLKPKQAENPTKLIDKNLPHLLDFDFSECTRNQRLMLVMGAREFCKENFGGEFLRVETAGSISYDTESRWYGHSDGTFALREKSDRKLLKQHIQSEIDNL